MRQVEKLLVLVLVVIGIVMAACAQNEVRVQPGQKVQAGGRGIVSVMYAVQGAGRSAHHQIGFDAVRCQRLQRAHLQCAAIGSAAQHKPDHVDLLNCYSFLRRTYCLSMVYNTRGVMIIADMAMMNSNRPSKGAGIS